MNTITVNGQSTTTTHTLSAAELIQTAADLGLPAAGLDALRHAQRTGAGSTHHLVLSTFKGAPHTLTITWAEEDGLTLTVRVVGITSTYTSAEDTTVMVPSN